jgi:hypothetical protein
VAEQPLSPIESCWHIFRKEAVGEYPMPGQLEAMYMAFLAGAAGILQLEPTVREREASYRRKQAFADWKGFVDAELKRVSEGGAPPLPPAKAR